MKTYLKTYMYGEHEIDCILANLHEAKGHIDAFLVYEYDVYHTGMPRNTSSDKPIYPKLMEALKGVDGGELVKIRYVSLKDEVKIAHDNEPLIHAWNEPVMRSYCLKDPEVNIQREDIIFSVDADEIVFRDTYPRIQGSLKFASSPAIRLPMHQFFYKPNYLWKNKTFRSAVATYAHRWQYPSNIRDVGIDLPQPMAGAHMSWCMSVPQMMRKLFTYSHPKFRNCAKPEILEAAIRDRTYPFDPNTNFDIEVLDVNDERIPEWMRGKVESC